MKYNMKISKNVPILVKNLAIKEGDKVAITFNTEFQEEVAHEVAEIVSCKGAKPIMIYVPVYHIYHKERNSEESCMAKESVVQIIIDADVWIELER